MDENQKNNPRKYQSEDTKVKRAKRLYKILFESPKSRRMAATDLGYDDQTFMVTQNVSDWIKKGRAQVIGKIKCSRSGRFVQGVTTNPELFKDDKDEQTELF